MYRSRNGSALQVIAGLGGAAFRIEMGVGQTKRTVGTIVEKTDRMWRGYGCWNVSRPLRNARRRQFFSILRSIGGSLFTSQAVTYEKARLAA
jgi:hypothetical protein